MRTRNDTTRQSILLAARKLFLQKGFTATRLDDIAHKAMVTKQTIYGYYADKQALFMGVIETTIDPHYTPATLPEQLKNLEDLRPLLYDMASHIEAVIAQPEYPGLLRLVIAESIRQPELGLLFERGVTAQSIGVLTALFTRAQAVGIIPPADPVFRARMFMGNFVSRIFLEGVLLHAQYPRVRRQSRKELHDYVDLFMSQLGRL